MVQYETLLHRNSRSFAYEMHHRSLIMCFSIKQSHMSGFVRLLLVNFGPRGGMGSGLTRCLGENRKSSWCKDSACDHQ